MVRGKRENGMFRFSWFAGRRNLEFLGFFLWTGPSIWAIIYCHKNWEKLRLNTYWYNTLNDKADSGYRMRLTQGLEDPSGLRSRLNKLQAPEEYAPHLPADDFVVPRQAIYRKD